jgi:hypothetical protein
MVDGGQGLPRAAVLLVNRAVGWKSWDQQFYDLRKLGLLSFLHQLCWVGKLPRLIRSWHLYFCLMTSLAYYPGYNIFYFSLLCKS